MSGTNAQCFVFLGARKVSVDGEAPGAREDTGVLVLGDEVREEDEEDMEVGDRVSSPHFPCNLKGRNGSRGC